MKKPWSLMPFWQSKDWSALKGCLKLPHFNPGEGLFRPLRYLAPHEISVFIGGQDPYPDPHYATGTAFDIPPNSYPFPSSLQNIFKEYCSDLGHPYPTSGSLEPWLKQGVFLWNVIPTCKPWTSMSHDWASWEPLNEQMIDLIYKANEPYGGIVWVFLGSVARRYVGILPDDAVVLEYSHPSPRGAYSGRNPFMGSRLFSTINDKLIEIGRKPIDWKLPEPIIEVEGIPDETAKLGEELLQETFS